MKLICGGYFWVYLFVFVLNVWRVLDLASAYLLEMLLRELIIPSFWCEGLWGHGRG
ncbi:hypothetical protein SynRS9907_00927 [Synechococcus sp. RS9907]|nr:hypothetical protein SynRS9907_00927 [Synechococcus sp. RS9907]